MCIQQSQQNRAAVNSYGGYSAVIVNRGVFMSCMGAHWYLLDPSGQERPFLAPRLGWWTKSSGAKEIVAVRVLI